MEAQVKQDPWIRRITPEITSPSLRDNTADVDRLVQGIRKRLETDSVFVDFSLVRDLTHSLRGYDYRVDCLLFRGLDFESWHLVDVLPSYEESSVYGLAVDLGTSTVAMRLLDVTGMKTLDETSFPNPQIEIGPDILTRIHFCAQKGGLEKLRHLIIEGINQEIDRIAKRHHISTRSILGLSLAGNTTMTHLLLGLDPYWICREPYIPVINSPDLVKSKDLGLGIHPRAPVLVFPNVGSYFGGDLVAGILASGMARQDVVSILVDVGTNAEVVIGNSEWLMGCAGAAGPALEGGVAGMGMMAGPGVIDKVIVDPVSGDFSIRTIGNLPPVGICGSGLIDLVAQLFLGGMIDLRGKYVPDRCGERLIEVEGIEHIIVVSPEDSATGSALTLSQPDIDALMRSKAAMYTILTTITNTLNIAMQEISRFYIAGTFGVYIDPRSAITVGMIPDLPMGTYVPLGNTSLEGATRALVSGAARGEAFAIRDKITYLELNVNQEFMNLFSAAKFIPHTDTSLFPSVNLDGHNRF
jgi:uncharacterized 2Fe-2S/4Fe-4S cluster protein (DUF4445 family)